MRSDLDRVNQAAYRSRGAIRQYGTALGWLDAGERTALAHALAQLRGGAILDIGVGGGRTAPLLSGAAESYCGIDYTAALIEVARRRFPTLDLREMDARDLEFPDAHFRLVVFTYNGIDSVAPADRLRILHEVFRVLAPGGAFVFSSLNRAGPAFNEGWWPTEPSLHFRGVPGFLRRARRLALGAWRSFHHRSLRQDSGETALAPLSVHDFGIVAFFTTLHAQILQLKDAGFIVEAIFDDATGHAVDRHAPCAGAPWYYYAARKPDTEAIERTAPSLTSERVSAH